VSQKKPSVKKKLRYIDLFSGAGGLALGFENQGFENVFSLDFEKSFCETYRTNFPDHTLIEKDISKLTESEIVKLTKGKKIDVIVGGPPCQGFSIAGNIGRKFINDPRNQLFKEFARFVKIIQPRFFVMENVARLYAHNNGETRAEMTALFEKMGYTVDSKILNSADYGVPQVRKRVVFIGTKHGNKILFPEKEVEEYATVGGALKGFLKIIPDGSSSIPNHEAMNHSEQMLTKMKHVQDGGTRLQIPVSLRPTSGDVRKYIRYDSKKPSVCITGDMRKVFHYFHNRALTVRELAKLQSFPDDFVFKGSKISQQQQVGNAVPPLMAEAIAKKIKLMSNHEK
jgi:DNA (cytosine-5)-methyltransferase 1